MKDSIFPTELKASEDRLEGVLFNICGGCLDSTDLPHFSQEVASYLLTRVAHRARTDVQ